MIGIYLIINSINGMMYVGSSSNIKVRFYQHILALNNNRHKNSYLQNAWNKHGGLDAFHFCVVEECLIEDLEIIEQAWLDSVFNKYNLSDKANTSELSDISRLKISLALSGRTLSKEHKEKISLAGKERKSKGHYNTINPAQYLPSWTGKKHTQETKLKISKSLTGKPLSDDRKKAIALGLQKRRERLALEASRLGPT